MDEARKTRLLEFAAEIDSLAAKWVAIGGPIDNMGKIHTQRAADIRAVIAEAEGAEGAEDNYDGAMADLDSAIDVLIRRINGDADLPSAAEWVRRNYPKKAAALARPTP